MDNNENEKGTVKRNRGRELLELVSMGGGNYTAVDVRESSRAFTGWTITPKLPRFPMGRFDWEFKYNSADHDNDEKTFLGETGNFNGEDIIDIVCQHPATAQFIARHLYNFFVADEAQVPAWTGTPPKDKDAIDLLADTFTESGYDMTAVLRVLFNSEFFKNARFARLKSPTEVIIGTLRLVGGAEFPAPGLGELARQPSYMGQDLLNPPSVEGWHTGAEWINSGSLMRRVNYTAELIGDTSRPGIQSIIARLKAQGTQSPQQIVENCLDLLGPLDVNPESMTELTGFVGERGDFDWDSAESTQTSTERVGELLQLIVSLREYHEP